MVNKPSGSLFPVMALQCNHRTPEAKLYEQNNYYIYQSLVQTKIIISLVIGTMITSNQIKGLADNHWSTTFYAIKCNDRK